MSWHVLYQSDSRDNANSFMQTNWMVHCNMVSVPDDRDYLKLETVLRLTRYPVLWHRDAMKTNILYGLSVSKVFN